MNSERMQEFVMIGVSRQQEMPAQLRAMPPRGRRAHQTCRRIRSGKGVIERAFAKAFIRPVPRSAATLQSIVFHSSALFLPVVRCCGWLGKIIEFIKQRGFALRDCEFPG